MYHLLRNIFQNKYKTCHDVTAGHSRYSKQAKGELCAFDYHRH